MTATFLGFVQSPTCFHFMPLYLTLAQVFLGQHSRHFQLYQKPLIGPKLLVLVVFIGSQQAQLFSALRAAVGA